MALYGPKKDIAGLYCIDFRTELKSVVYYNFHFFIKKECRQWGFSKDWYDGPIWSFGFGPFFLIVACYI